MKKEFIIVGRLEMKFKNDTSMKVVGRDVVPTTVTVDFDEKGIENTCVEICQYEIEHGLMSCSRIIMPPMIEYDFKDYLEAKYPPQQNKQPSHQAWKLEGKV